MKGLFIKTLFCSTLIFLSVIGIVPTEIGRAHTDVQSKNFIITISKEEFNPQKIEVPVGSTIIFKNIGEEGHWPASNDHPSHTLYNGTSLEEHCAVPTPDVFDSCKELDPGESWSFTFTKMGTFTYHDHLWPQLGGEIRVIQGENNYGKIYTFFSTLYSYFKARVSYIRGIFTKDTPSVGLQTGTLNAEEYKELKNKYEHIVLASNPREAIHTLRDESLQNSKTQSFCHDILHIIGKTAYKKYGSFKDAVIYQEDFCNSGYIHGLFEAYFQSTPNPLVGLAEQCREYGKDKRPFDIWQCNHGIGHGFMYLTGGDLDTSLNLCTESLHGDAIESCHNGVYMEVFNSEIVGKEKSFVDSENPFETCRIRSIAKADCYLYAPTYISQTLGKDFKDIITDCNALESPYSSLCIRGVSSEVLKRNMHDLDAVFGFCEQSGGIKTQHTCVQGVVSMYMNQKGSLEAGLEMCTAAPSSYQATCRQTVENHRASYTKS